MTKTSNIIFIQLFHNLGFVLNTYAYWDDRIKWHEIMDELPMTYGSIRISVLKVK
jgi:hypothetical protein